MKKWLIIAVSIIAFLFLILRTLTDHLDGLRNEKQSYVEKLNFQISGTIDSVEFLSKKNGSFFFGNTFPMPPSVGRSFKILHLPPIYTIRAVGENLLKSRGKPMELFAVSI